MIRLLPALGLCLLGCSSQSPGVCDDGDESMVLVVNELTLARQVDGVSNGFDLDGATTQDGDASGCGIGDYHRFDGTGGIDNALARLIPALELTEAVALEDLAQQAINQGELLLMFELADLQSAQDDSCVDLTLFRGAGTPTIGTHGVIEPAQSFDTDPSVPPSRAPGLAIEAGTLEANDLVIHLPLELFDATLDATLDPGAVHLELREDGDFRGFLGGSLDFHKIVQMAQDSNVDEGLAAALPALFASAADMHPDANGDCQRISATFEIRGVRAFLYDDTEPLH